MDYNPLIDLAVFGAFLLAIGAVIVYMERRPKRGATPATRQQIIIHQQVRRIENE